jgi:hypothetical protein
MKMTMTPYEIRLELVKLAKDMLSEEFNTRHSAVKSEWEVLCSAAMGNKTQLPSQPNYPKYFTEDDVLDKATRLNDFISNGK